MTERRTTTQLDYQTRVLRVLVHIQNHLDDALDLEHLASIANFSPHHFHRIFRGLVGEPVKEHVRRLRLERSAHQLKTTGESVTQIAFSAGYETHEAYTRAFRAMFDRSPTEFRQSNREQPIPNSPSGVRYAPDETIDHLQEIALMFDESNVRIVETKDRRVAFMRHTGPYDHVGDTWQKFMSWVMANGMFNRINSVFAAAHDDPEVTPPDKLRYDCCIEVDDSFEPSGEIGVQTIASGKYASATHKGPYSELGQFYGGLMGQWMPKNNHRPANGPCLESYKNNPQNTPPEELLTEVFVPIA